MNKTILGALAVLLTLSQVLTWSQGQLAAAAPTQLSQFKLDGVTSIGVGGQTDETGAIFKGLMSRGGGTQYRLAIEIRPIGAVFTNTPTAVSALTDYGTTAEDTVPLWKIRHHWQAWAIDNNRVGQAASFPRAPVNAENQSDIEAIYAGTIYYVSAAGNDVTGTPDDPTRPYRSPLGAGVGATHRIILRAAAGTTPTMDAHSSADGSLGSSGPNNLTLRVLSNNVVVHGMHFINT